MAARIHGNDEAVRSTAKRCAKKLPRSQRHSMYAIINDRAPRAYIRRAIQDVEVPRLADTVCPTEFSRQIQ
nr:hypothetical protein [Pseudomonas sp. JG-B]